HAHPPPSLHDALPISIRAARLHNAVRPEKNAIPLTELELVSVGLKCLGLQHPQRQMVGWQDTELAPAPQKAGRHASHPDFKLARSEEHTSELQSRENL